MKISFSGTLLRFVNFQKQVEIADANTVRDALESIIENFPDLKPILFTEYQKLRPVHKIFVGSKMVLPSDIDKEMQNMDEMEILTAIAGG